MILTSAASSGAGAEAGALVFNATCTSTEQVGDAVYVITSPAGNVRQADASAVSTSRVVGFIQAKASATACEVQVAGKIGGFSSLTPGVTYFLSETSGDVAATPGSVVVAVGEALTATTLVIRLEEVEDIT